MGVCNSAISRRTPPTDLTSHTLHSDPDGSRWNSAYSSKGIVDSLGESSSIRGVSLWSVIISTLSASVAIIANGCLYRLRRQVTCSKLSFLSQTTEFSYAAKSVFLSHFFHRSPLQDSSVIKKEIHSHVQLQVSKPRPTPPNHHSKATRKKKEPHRKVKYLTTKNGPQPTPLPPRPLPRPPPPNPPTARPPPQPSRLLSLHPRLPNRDLRPALPPLLPLLRPANSPRPPPSRTRGIPQRYDGI